MNKDLARKILKDKYYFKNGKEVEGKEEALVLIDEAIDYLLTLEDVTHCKECRYAYPSKEEKND